MFSHTRKTIIFFIGDVILLYLSLGILLAGRYFPFPEFEIFHQHFAAFSVLIAMWLLVFFIAGLYERQVLFSRRVLAGRLFKTQAINSIVAVFFFYLIPFFSIAPKTNLFLYLVISSALIVIWRLYSTPLIEVSAVQKAVLIASGEEMKDLKRAVNDNSRYGIQFVLEYDTNTLGIRPVEEIITSMQRKDISLIVLDINHKNIEPLLPHVYDRFFAGVPIIDVHDFYEDVFNRVPLSLLHYRWFLQNIESTTHSLYAFFKRLMDMTAAFVLGVVTLPFYPFVYLAIKLDDGGALFFRQKRVGENNRPIHIIKFRSMSQAGGGEAHISRVGAFLRRSRIDELPQLWNVLKGDLSLIGPRPEINILVKEYEAEISYYTMRHIIKPGLSGWAQLYHENHPHHSSDVYETQRKLSYDLYYIKNRSFLLDVVIALKTVRTLFSRSGR